MAKTSMKRVSFALLPLLLVVLSVLVPAAFATDNHQPGPKISAITMDFYRFTSDPNTVFLTVKLDALPGRVLPSVVRIDVVVSYKYPDTSGFTVFYTSSATVLSDGVHAEATFLLPFQGERNYFIEAYTYDALTNELLGFRQRDPLLDTREGLPG